MDVHVALGEPPRLTGVDDLQSFSVIAAAGRDAAPTLAAELDGVMQFEGTAHAWVSVNWLIETSGHADSTEWRARFDAMTAYAARKGWTRADPPAIRGHVVWQDGRAHE